MAEVELVAREGERVWLCWDFVDSNDVRLRGSQEHRGLTFTHELCAKMNAEFGEGSHWVEVARQLEAAE